MGVLRSAISKRPLAAAAFVKWLSAREVLSPLSPHVRSVVTDLPITMAYGLVVEFLSEHGVKASIHITPKGRHKVILYRKRPAGTYVSSHNSRAFASYKLAMEDVVTGGFQLLDRMISNVLPQKGDKDSILVGIDVDAIMARANQSLLQWRN